MAAIENAPVLSPKEAGSACLYVLKATLEARKAGADMNMVPLMIGDPGVGKTSIARQIAKKLGMDGVIVITPTIYNTFDLRGLPYVKEGVTKFAPSTILPRDGRWIILVDELADCPPHEQSGFYQLLLEGKLGEEYTIPPGCLVIGATNDDTMGACANPLSTAIRTRVVPMYVKSNLDASVDYASKNNWHPQVIAFMRWQPGVLDGFDSEDFAGGSTGRGLEQLSLQETAAPPQDTNVALALSVGYLGMNYGTKYAAFRQLEVPSADLVFQDPENAPIFEEQRDKYYAYSAHLARYCDTPTKFKALLKYVKRFSSDVDRVSLVFDVTRANPKLEECPDCAQFYVANHKMVV